MCGKRCLGQRGGVGASRGWRVDDFFGFAWGCSLLHGTEPVQSLLVFDLAVAELFVFGQEYVLMIFRCEKRRQLCWLPAAPLEPQARPRRPHARRKRCMHDLSA